MTASELIHLLQKCNPEVDVHFQCKGISYTIADVFEKKYLTLDLATETNYIILEGWD